MNHVDAGARPGNRPDVRPSRDDRCAECGEALGDDNWVCYRRDPDDQRNVIKDFGGVVKTGPAAPPAPFRTRTLAILLIGGNKGGDDRFYERMIPIADRIYDEHLEELEKEQRRKSDSEEK